MKITERDKMLLVLLAIILVVALVVVLPGIGVMSCNESVASYAIKETEVDVEIDELKPQLIERGVRLSVAETRADAARLLEEDTWDLKEEAARLAGNIMAYSQTYGSWSWPSTAVYRYGIDDGSPLLGIEDRSIPEVEDNVYELDNIEYVLKSTDITVKVAITDESDCLYPLEYILEGEEEDEEFGAVLLYLLNLTDKGSILITKVTGPAEGSFKGKWTIGFTLLMTPTTGIDTYRQQIINRDAALAEEE